MLNLLGGSMSENKDRLFNLKITEELRRKIKKDAYEKDKSASAVVREILEDYYNKKDNDL